MSQCAKQLACDTHRRVRHSLRSLENYSLTQNRSLLRPLLDKEKTYFKFANVSGRLWGWTRFLRASGASDQQFQFQSYKYTLYCLAYISSYSLIFQRFWTSRGTILCGNITIYVKHLINCKLLSVGNSIKTTGFSGWCEYFNVPMCHTVRLWHTFTRPSLAALARKL